DSRVSRLRRSPMTKGALLEPFSLWHSSSSSAALENGLREFRTKSRYNTVRTALAIVMLGIGAVPVRAEIVFFATGRNISVQSHRIEGDTLVLQMRGGGEMTCEASLVTHIDPD